MTPQIELLFVPSLDGSAYYPLVAVLAGFVWSPDEQAAGIIGDCPDTVYGSDVGQLLTALTADGANAQVTFPFAVLNAHGRMSKRSSWQLNTPLLDPRYTADDPGKPTLPADSVTAAMEGV